MKTDTPRTDALWSERLYAHPFLEMEVEETKLMERELNEAKDEILRLRAELQAIVIEADITDHGDGYVEICRETFNKVRLTLNKE